MYIGFIDYVKAFDNVQRNLLWDILKDKGFPLHLIRAIQSLYTETKIQITSGTRRSKENILTNLGVRQGCPLSPALFNLYIDQVTQDWIESTKKLYKTVLTTLLFADDQLVIAASEDGLQKLIYELQITASNYNLTISPTKTKILAFQGKTQVRCKILINDNIVEQVRDFKYLGCEIGNTRELDQQRKLQNFNQICGTIKRTLLNKTRKETILKFYKVLAVPSLLYGSECWTLTENQKHKIEVSEMRFLRSVAGYRRTDRQYNETIRDELNIFNLNNKIKEYQEKYYEHVQRMPEYRIPKKILEYKPKGKRDRGRPTKRWRDQFL